MSVFSFRNNVGLCETVAAMRQSFYFRFTYSREVQKSTLQQKIGETLQQ